MKELSIEEKSRAYDEAIDKVAYFIKKHVGLGIGCIIHPNSSEAKELFNIFPELAETEDEKIRKEIIALFKGQIPFTSKEDNEKFVAWLEKQGNIDKASYEIAEKEKYDFVSGQFIECRKSFNEFKEDTSYWFEYVGNDTYIGRSDNILNKKFHITPRQLYRLFTQQHCPKGNNVVNEETNAPTAYGKYVDECLNEAAKHFLSEGEDKYSIADLFYAGIRCGQSWFEKQGEQTSKNDSTDTCDSSNINGKEFPAGGKRDFGYFKENSANKVKPKFKVGDWIVSNVSHEDYRICKILNIKNGEYVIESIYGYQGHNNFETFDKDYHLWSIKDAKDGDVLAVTMYPEGTWIGIFKEQNSCTFSSYCFVNTKGVFKRGSRNHGNGEAIYPATKEQRVVLLTKMKEAEYTFDFEKKELKKIENVEISFGAKDSELQEATYFIPKGFYAEIDDDKVVIKKGEKPTTWSEEDEEMLEDVRNNFEYNKGEMTDSLIAQYDKFFDKIKFLKPQPKQEWSEEDKNRFTNLILLVKCSKENDATKEGFINFINKLKSIKDKNS